MLLQNAHSFLLVKSVAVRPVVLGTQEFATKREILLPNSHSFLLVSPLRSKAPQLTWELSDDHALQADQVVPGTSAETEKEVRDKRKRAFLKAAGIASAGIAASLILPKKAEALVLGSSPTTGVVGVKNAANTRINPATEETLDEVLKTSDLTFDAGALEVKVTSLPGGGMSSFSDSGDVAKSALVDVDRHAQVDVLSSALPASASTEDTLQTISFGGSKFAVRLATDSVDSNLEYVGEAAVGATTSATSWRIKQIDSTTGVVITWADGNELFDNTWDGREGLTYS